VAEVHTDHSVDSHREHLKWFGKILGGIAFAVIFLGVVAPIVLAVIVGLADGH